MEDPEGYTNRQQGNLTNLLFFFQNKESRLTIEELLNAVLYMRSESYQTFNM
jgi:hypothetical protein